MGTEAQLIPAPPVQSGGLYKRDGSPRKRSNQWLKREELGGIPERDRARHRAECAAAYLEHVMTGRAQSNTNRVQAARALMDKGLASLSAVEQTILEPAAISDEATLYASLREIIKQHPDILAQLNAEAAQSSPNPGPQPAAPQPTGVQPQQSAEEAA